ncbi:RagB/SusD family nutrient uptake outer membrane protein [Pinibacter aurantiacus]|uniref:RagB/SusD family nutrient uptake outer membrane protein n=1 Tax=Pinibacter aurantiacus TaxID=2851599 RepID=A0A9E2S3E9_9BACT|nr:RagB/SusD family nutrient uptake outer membrane protein [Pinibacter aurantiacus]MBV4355883.1 RagB/SusD family nutrient uptake outer membrane protein [Pinibacter aurantiacus]
MKSLRIITITLLVTTLTACNKWLDVQPKTTMKADVLFTTQAGFRDAITGIYSNMTTASSYGTELTLGFTDVLAQTYDNVPTALNHKYLNSANYNYTEAFEQIRIAKLWTQAYKSITNANILLSYIDDKKQVFTGKNYNLIKGEALGLRAYLHFDVLRLFAPSPVMGADRKAIPYVDTYTNVPFPQLSTAQVMDKIAGDLTAAQALLKDADTYGPNRASFDLTEVNEIAGTRRYRMNYYAVTALLARVELYRNNKTAALAYAKEVIDAGLFPAYSPSGQTAAGDNVFPLEHVFSLTIPDLKTKYADVYFLQVADGQNVNSLSISADLLNTIYPSGLNTDYRISWFQDNSAKTKRVTKYTYNTVIPLLKISEMYLIAAEAEPSVSSAMAYLNVLRAHRGLSPLDAASYTRETLDKEIGDEYRREFIAEGQLFYYYKRMNADKLPTLAAFKNKEAVYILPIPVAEKEFGNIE